MSLPPDPLRGLWSIPTLCSQERPGPNILCPCWENLPGSSLGHCSFPLRSWRTLCCICVTPAQLFGPFLMSFPWLARPSKNTSFVTGMSWSADRDCKNTQCATVSCAIVKWGDRFNAEAVGSCLTGMQHYKYVDVGMGGFSVLCVSLSRSDPRARHPWPFPKSAEQYLVCSQKGGEGQVMDTKNFLL